MLIANAPHMPVHLGSMGESVRTILRLRGARMRPGDVFALNNPYNGGTHLPDVTVIMPVFGADGQLLFFTASRGHHADIGGITPGSMPPNSHLDRRGRRADRQFPAGRRGAVSRGGARCAARRRAAIRPATRARTWPTCRPRSRPARKGAAELLRMIAQFGLETVQAYMRHVQDNAEESVRRVLGALKDGAFSYPLDNGAQDPGAGRASTARRAARSSTSPARARSSPTTSTRRRRSAGRRCCTCSARWSTSRSR